MSRVQSNHAFGHPRIRPIEVLYFEGDTDMTIVVCGEPEISLQGVEAFVAVPAPPVSFEFFKIGKECRPPVEVIDPSTGSKSTQVRCDDEVLGCPIRVRLFCSARKLNYALMTDDHFIHDLILHYGQLSFAKRAIAGGGVTEVASRRGILYRTLKDSR